MASQERKRERKRRGEASKWEREEERSDVESGKEERTIGTPGNYLVRTESNRGSFKFHFVLLSRCMCAHS